jgi:hypothetical protein
VVAGTRLAEGHDEVGPQGEIAAPEHAKPNFAVMHEAGTGLLPPLLPALALRDQPKRAMLVMPSVSACGSGADPRRRRCFDRCSDLVEVRAAEVERRGTDPFVDLLGSARSHDGASDTGPGERPGDGVVLCLSATAFIVLASSCASASRR